MLPDRICVIILYASEEQNLPVAAVPIRAQWLISMRKKAPWRWLWLLRRSTIILFKWWFHCCPANDLPEKLAKLFLCQTHLDALRWSKGTLVGRLAGGRLVVGWTLDGRTAFLATLAPQNYAVKMAIRMAPAITINHTAAPNIVWFLTEY